MKNLATLALVATIGTFGGAFGGAALAQDTAAPATAEAPQVRDMTMGQADAPIEMIEYASYTCPHCADFHSNVFGQLKTEYIDTGKVRFVMREVYFDRYGLWAAMMARCGGDMRYFGISDILFETQREWAGSQDPAVVVENLKRIGRQAGMDNATIDACMADGATAQALVEHYETNAANDQISGTPTIIINGEKHSNMSYEDLKEILDAEL